ncbi:Atg29 N-terminal domain-containing protein [Microdochium nivale]|nr:Atg29 N-terminal domain-containing protein [Microdochium nivale]
MTTSTSDPTYTVFIRLPFPRGDFVDPPPVNWDLSKDEALWSIVSRVSKTEIDWNEIAGRFQVTVDFLLQQVAWLTERHAAQLRAQMRRAAVAAKGSPAPSPQPGPEGPFAAEAMRRTGSAGGASGIQSSHPRAPSSLSARKVEASAIRNDLSRPETPIRTSIRQIADRPSSSNTGVSTPRNLGPGLVGRQNVQASGADSQRRRLSSLPITTTAAAPDPGLLSPDPADASQPASPSPSSSSSSSESSGPAQSRIIRRPPRFRSNDPTASFADDDDDEDEPAFRQFQPQAASSSGGPHHDLSATLRGDQKRHSKHSMRDHRVHRSQHSDSSSSSAAAFRGPSDKSSGPAGPLSPRRTSELAGRSPGVKGKGHSRDSDGTPSMGSSFSDLDDASVTQSALEEALASKMGDGGTIASLRGTIGNAFRGRYMPKPS